MRAPGSTTVLEDARWLRSPTQRGIQHSAPELDEKRVAENRYADDPFFNKSVEQIGASPTEVLFGSFRLLTEQFLLLEDGAPVPLGSRALEILIVLLERPGELVSKQELMSRVWPNVFVEPANLTVHISALRRALGDGQAGNRFIINIPGRGYRFVASVAVVARVKVDTDYRPAKSRVDNPSHEDCAVMAAMSSLATDEAA